MQTHRPVFLNPFTDYGFKKIFGTEANKPLLIDFLNSILPKHHQIADLDFKNTEQLGQTEQERKAIYDIYCQSSTGERFIVELQRAKQDFFKDRSVYYATLPITEQAQKGSWNYELKAVYCVAILDFCFDEHKGDNDVIHTVKLKDQNNDIFYDKLSLIYLEMPKFIKSENQLENNLDKWLFYINNLKDLQMIPTIFTNNQVFEQAFATAKLANLSRDEWQKYQYSLKNYRDNLATDNYLIEQGRQEGIITGRQEGIIAGRLEGENLAKQTMVYQLHKMGMDNEFIAQAVQLSLDDINALIDT